MTLVISRLQSDIFDVFSRQLDDKREIARLIAIAYQSYANSAQSPPGAPMNLTGTEHKKLESELLFLMNRSLPPGEAANRVGNAVYMFWLAPPVTSGAGGVVTNLVHASGVGRMAGTNVDSDRSAANAMASALDSITRTVFVTNPPPNPSGTLI